MQGEREMAAHNRSLGQFNLVGIPAAPRGMPQVEVSFDIDANGILTVSAKDKATGKENKIEIKDSSGLSPEEIDKMKSDAEQFAEEDKKQREVVDARNQADHLVYTTEQTLKEHGDKVPAEELAAAETAVNQTKEAMKGDDADAIKKSMENLMTASQALGKIMYEEAAKQTQAGAAQQTDADGEPVGAAAATDDKKDDDVIDAEFEVKEEK